MLRKVQTNTNDPKVGKVNKSPPSKNPVGILERIRQGNWNCKQFLPLINFFRKNIICSHVSDQTIVHLLSWIQTQYDSKGGLECIKMVKTIKLHCSAYLSGKPLLVSDHPLIYLTRDGIPTIISNWIPALRQHQHRGIAELYTILSIVRLIPGRKAPNYNEITDPYKGIEPDNTLIEEIKHLTRSTYKKYIRNSVLPWQGLHFSTKVGPNCQAMLGAEKELELLKEEKSILEDLKLLGGPKFVEYLDKGDINSSARSSEVIKHLQNEALGSEELSKEKGERNRARRLPKSSRLRSISVIEEPEGKSRIIAIFDYWSQSVLKGYHQEMMNILRDTENDCTFNQQDWLPLFKGSHVGLYSADLKSATDRFPLWFQEIVFDEIFKSGTDQALSVSLRNVLIKLPFQTNEQQKEIKYTVGQPMGAYGSWTLFTLAHHIVVRMAFRRCGKNTSEGDYRILGDDIVIRGRAPYDEYRKIMKSLGVEIQDKKTFESDLGQFAEFARRPILKGKDVGGISLRAFDSANSPMTLVEELSTATRRLGFNLQLSRDILVEYWKIKVFRNPTLVRTLTYKTLLYWYMPLGPKGYSRPTSHFFEVLGFGFGISGLKEKQRQGLLGRAMARSHLENVHMTNMRLRDMLMNFYRAYANAEAEEKSQSGVAPTPLARPIVFQAVVAMNSKQRITMDALSDAMESGRWDSVAFTDCLPELYDPLKILVERPQAKLLKLKCKYIDRAILFIKEYYNTIESLKHVPAEGNKHSDKSEYVPKVVGEITLPIGPDDDDD